MKNLTKLVGITIFAVVIGFSMAACKNDTTPSTGSGTPTPTGDTWSNVTSFSQVNGTWKAPATVSGTFEGIRITQTFTNYTITFNATAKTMSAAGTGTTTFSGGEIADAWAELKADMQGYYEDISGITVTFDDANHSYTMVTTNFSQTMTDSDLAQMGMQINQNSTKLKFDSEFGYAITYTK